MSTVNNNNQEENIHEENESSSLGYLHQGNEEGEKSSPNENSKKRPGPEIDRDSEVRRVYINQRMK